MERICTNCNFIGKEVRTVYFYILGPLILLVFGLLSYPYLSNVSAVATISSLAWIVFGIYTLVKFIETKNECPNCNQKRTMIPLDTPKAEQLIKENNLTVPE